MKTSYAGVAQLAEQLICNQQVAGSSPITSSSYDLYMDGFPSGQRERTVNPLSQTTMVRIHPRPPFLFADMAELADAYGSGPYGGNFVEVQVLLSAPKNQAPHTVSDFLFVIFEDLKPR